MVSFHFEEAAYLHHCLKIETADEIRTRANHNFQNKIIFNFVLKIMVGTCSNFVSSLYFQAMM